jgi:hypothetical protein
MGNPVRVKVGQVARLSGVFLVLGVLFIAYVKEPEKAEI